MDEIQNPNEYFDKIGKKPLTEKKKICLEQLKVLSTQTMCEMENKISTLDINDHTFEGGCQFLLSWYPK